MFSLRFHNDDVFDKHYFKPNTLEKIRRWERMTVGDAITKTNKVNLDVRNCYTTDTKLSFFVPLGRINPFKNKENITIIENFFTKYYDPIILDEITRNKKQYWLSYDHEGYNYDFRILKYTEGCFFQRHSDGQKNKFHIGTMILLPPLKYNDYTGGELVVYEKDENTQQERETVFQSHDTDWTFIFLKIGTEHEVKKVTSGVRYSFTCDYSISEAMYYILHNKKFHEKAIMSEKDLDEMKMKNTKRMYEIEKQLQELTDELNTLKTENEPFQQKFIDRIKQDIQEKKITKCMVMCDRFYEFPSLDKLNYKDKLVYNKLHENFKCSIQFLHFAVEFDRGDGDVISVSNDYTDFNIGWETDDIRGIYWNRENQKLGLIVNNGYVIRRDYPFYYYNDYEKEDKVPGVIQEIDSRYNDQTYDSIYQNFITCMFVSFL